MTSYRPAPNRLATGRSRLRAVAHLVTREPTVETADEVAAHYGVSASYLYRLTSAVEGWLTPRRAGPPAGVRTIPQLEATIDSLHRRVVASEAENARLRHELRAVPAVDADRVARLELVCFASGVSLRRTREVVAVALGERWRPRLADLQARMAAHGKTAERLLTAVEAEVAPRVTCVAADDIYFRGKAVKVVAEPASVAILGIGRDPGTARADWAAWLSPYTSLDLLVSDLGGGLLGAAQDRGVAHQADYFHEKKWLNDHLLTPLGEHADRAWEALNDALDRATRVEGPGRRLGPAALARATAENQAAEGWFFAACDVVDTVDALFAATDPANGRLWTPLRTAAVLREAVDALVRIPLPAAARAARHLRRYGHRFSTWGRVFDAIDVHLHPAAVGASHRGVLDDLLTLWALQRQIQGSGEASETRLVDIQRRITRFERRLRHTCANLDDVARALQVALAWPRRSSSMVESLNSRLRVLQTSHRNVSDGMLALHALAWNLSPRRHAGKRRHQSPYAMLGASIAREGIPWYDVLLRAEAAAA